MQLNRILRAAPLALAALLAACGQSGGDTIIEVVNPTPGSSPTPTPSPTGSGLPTSVLGCFSQVIIGTDGQSLAELIIPDMVTLDFQLPSEFPNGRFPDDPVVDIELAAIFLDLRTESVLYFDQTNLNPDATPTALTGDIFPYLPARFPTNEASTPNGRNFAFETAPITQAALVERLANPAIATALIGGRAADSLGNNLTGAASSDSQKNGYNESTPSEDVTGRWRPELEARLLDFHRTLADDFRNDRDPSGNAPLRVCAN